MCGGDSGGEEFVCDECSCEVMVPVTWGECDRENCADDKEVDSNV